MAGSDRIGAFFQDIYPENTDCNLDGITEFADVQSVHFRDVPDPLWTGFECACLSGSGYGYPVCHFTDPYMGSGGYFHNQAILDSQGWDSIFEASSPANFRLEQLAVSVPDICDFDWNPFSIFKRFNQ